MALEAGTVAGAMSAGAPCSDAPVTRADGTPGWLLEQLGTTPCALVFVEAETQAARADADGADCGIRGLKVITVGAQASRGTRLADPQGPRQVALTVALPASRT